MMRRTWIAFFALAWLCACGKPDKTPTGDERSELFDPLTMGPREAPATVDPPPLRVLDYGPEGRTGQQWNVGQVRVRFNQPVRAVTSAREQDAVDWLSMRDHEGPVEGTAYFKSPELLVFEARENLPPAHRYELRLRDVDQTLAGPFDGGFEWSFETARPRVLLREPVDGGNLVPVDPPIFLTTTQAVDVSELRDRVRLSADGATVGFDIRPADDDERERMGHHGLGTLFRVDAHDSFPVGATVEVDVAPGWRSEAGPLRATDELSATFQIHPPLRVESVDCGKQEGDELCQIQPMIVEFSTPLAEDAGKHVTIRPRPAQFEVSARRFDESTTFWIDGRFLPGIDYELRVDAAATDVFGQKLGRTFTRKLRFEMPPPALYLTRQRGIVVDDGDPHLGISSRHVESVRVRAARVSSDKWLELAGSGELAPHRLPRVATLGPVTTREFDVGLVGPTEWASTPLDLEDLVGDWRGPVALSVEAVRSTQGYGLPAGQRAIVQYTSLVPSLITSTPRSLVWVNDLAKGEPASGVRATLHGPDSRVLGETDENGLVEFDGYAEAELKGTRFLVLDVDEPRETAILEFRHGFTEPTEDWLRPGESVRGAVVVERGVYRPGERLYFVGWAGLRTPHDAYGFTSLPENVSARVRLRDAKGTVLVSTDATVRRGKFWGALSIPESARLGAATVDVSIGSSSPVIQTSLRLEEVRTPQFQVSADVSSSEIVDDESVVLDVRANYFSGGPVDIADLRVKTSCHRTEPPSVDPAWQVGRPGFSWFGHGTMTRTPRGVKEIARGHSRVPIPSLGSKDGKTRTCLLTGVVRSRSFQEEGDTAVVLVHPAPRYIGVRYLDGAPSEGDDVTLQFAGFDLDGRLDDEAEGTLDVELQRTVREPVYVRRGGHRWFERYEESTETSRPCRPKLDGRATCRLRDLRPGSYRLEARLKSDERVRTELRFRVSDRRRRSPRTEEFVRIESPEEELAVGADADVVVRTARDVNGLLLVERFGFREYIPFRTRRKRASFSLPVDRSWVPQMRVRAYAIDRTADVPKLADAEAEISVATLNRRLDVAVDVQETASVRQTIPVAVRVSDADGPVVGRVAVWAVDEAILGLTDYRVPDLVESFLPRYIPDVSVYEDLQSVLPRFERERYDPYTAGLSGFGMGGSGYGRGAGGVAGNRANPPRSKFETTPLFVGDVPLENGEAELDFELPDNMTAFRVIAVASAPLHDDETPMRFGTGSSILRVDAPLIARPALPRFVRPGDRFELASIVDDRTGRKGVLAVTATIDGTAIAFEDGETAEWTGDVGGRAAQHRVGFAANAVEPGTAHVEIRAVHAPANGEAVIEDAVRVPLEVRPEPTITETVAVYGTLDDDQTRTTRVKPPGEIRPDYGGVSVSLTSTILGGLRDATRELVHYPYGCLEQTASRMLPLVALARLTEFVEADELPNATSVDEFVTAGIKKIVSMQRPDGGFSYWPGGGPSNAYVTAYATWVLHLADEAGHHVPSAVLDDARQYLVKSLGEVDTDLPDSVVYYEDIRRSIALHVLAEAGTVPPESAVDGLFARRKSLPAFSRAFIAMAVQRLDPADPRLSEVGRELRNLITEQSGTASVVESPRYDLGPVFHSDLRSSAIVMMALTRLSPDHPVIAKLARGLMARRHGGAWRNTQENAYALVAMSDYAAHFEETTPNFVGQVWVDRATLVDDVWKGRSSKERTGRLPMEQAKSVAGGGDGTVSVNIRRRGEGRAYYRLGMTYALTGRDIPAIARGIAVRRTFRDADGTSTPEPPRTVPAGDLLAIDVELDVDTLVRHVAIDVPLPAGLEGINLAIGSSKALPMSGHRGWWLSHSEYHDDRIVLFADVLQPGTHRHTVYVRATTPGAYSFPPTRAEAMYVPEVFGRTGGHALRVK